MKHYRKVYKDPHPMLKATLAALLAVALAEKRHLLLSYVAEHGSEGLVDYGDMMLEEGWHQYFDKTAQILTECAVDSSIETLDASGLDVTDNFVANVEDHTKQIARDEAADLLGLHYDHAHGVAVATVGGFTIGSVMVAQLEEILRKAEADQWSSAQIEQAIQDMSGFDPKRADALAHNSLALVSGRSARTVAAMTGATEKRSETVGDDKVCPQCAQNEADGWIDVNAKFSGSDTQDVPHHPNCRCDVIYQWQEVAVPA
jgi:hypothetical protein